MNEVTPSVDRIEQWFAARCDGEWEHQHGFKLESTDNPGWLITIADGVEESVFRALSVKLRHRFGPECIRESNQAQGAGLAYAPPPVEIINFSGDRVQIYTVSLRDCLEIAGEILAAITPEPKPQENYP